MAITLKLKDFNGPLDMLLFMIGKAKIDIKDIFVSQITDQYIQSVREAEELDMDEASSFIQMAATLLEIKSRSLLPKPPPPQDEEDPQTVLIRQLEEYARFKQIAADMQGFEKAAALMYPKLPEEYPLPPPSFEISGLTMQGLIVAFSNVMARIPKNEEETPVHIAQRIMREEHSVPQCMLQIIKRLRQGSQHFGDLLRDKPTKEEVVTYFLALLELLRLGRVSITQDEPYGEILLNSVNRRKKQ
ncbi:MAG: segregation/condensation protein A [Clostridiales bacterium]|nr:segregation/condensation protein A [Clostridiales bacterium]